MPPSEHLSERAGSATAATPPVATEIARLARQLMVAAAKRAPAFLEQTDDAVMLDLKANGIRCLVTAHAPDTALQPALSPREQEIVRMVSKGYPTKTIAAVLDISAWTVSTHLRRIFTKLGVRTRAAMVAHAIREGLIPPPEPTGDQLPAATPTSPPKAKRRSRLTPGAAAHTR